MKSVIIATLDARTVAAYVRCALKAWRGVRNRTYKARSGQVCAERVTACLIAESRTERERERYRVRLKEHRSYRENAEC